MSNIGLLSSNTPPHLFAFPLHHKQLPPSPPCQNPTTLSLTLNSKPTNKGKRYTQPSLQPQSMRLFLIPTLTCNSSFS